MRPEALTPSDLSRMVLELVARNEELQAEIVRLRGQLFGARG